MKNSLERLYNILLIPAQGIDKDLLKDFFYVNIEESNENKKRSPKPGAKPELPPADLPPANPKKYILSQTGDGFKIIGNPASDVIPKEIKVKLAYDRFDKNPFDKYSEYDFDVKKLRLTSSYINIDYRDRNVIRFRPLMKDFSISVSGFDKKRDLIVDVK